MKKRILFLAIMMFVVALMPARLDASPYVALQSGDRAQVLEIIDINAIRVRTARGDALVRLIGVHHGGTPEGINFLTREIMGANVYLVRDVAFHNVGRWNYMYVMHDGRFINGELILTGFGRINEAHYRAAQFENIQNGQAIAREAGLGMWAGELRMPVITQYGERININTASAAQIVTHLGATQDVANNIVSFRNAAVFQTVNDVKFVPGVTWEFFAANRNRMAISTNINTASAIELETLTNIEAEQAQAIVNSRTAGQSFTALNQLTGRGLITTGQLNSNIQFISLQNETLIHYARPNHRANINLASTTQLTAAGATLSQAANITSQRMHMPLRNLQDLTDMPGFSTLAQVNALADNLRTHTNINTAPRSEIESLFGFGVSAATVNNILNNRPFASVSQISHYMSEYTFSRIEPFVYIGSRTTDTRLININTATYEQMLEAGFYSTEASRLISVRPIWRPVQTAGGSPAWLRPEMRQISTLYTNINTASPQELLRLDAAMTQDIAARIVAYRNDQPFGSFTEVDEFFSGDQNMWTMYLRFRNFIILR